IDALGAMDAAFLLVPFTLPLALDNQRVVLDFHADVFLVHARQLSADDQVVVFLTHLDGRYEGADILPLRAAVAGEHAIHVLGEPPHQSERIHRKQVRRIAPETRNTSPLRTPLEAALPLLLSPLDVYFSH